MTRDWYEIEVEGELPGDWSYWFEGLRVRPGQNGSSIIDGPLADQSALHGVLARIRDLNLKLISLNRRSTPGSAGRPADER